MKMIRLKGPSMTESSLEFRKVPKTSPTPTSPTERATRYRLQVEVSASSLKPSYCMMQSVESLSFDPTGPLT